MDLELRVLKSLVQHHGCRIVKEIFAVPVVSPHVLGEIESFCDELDRTEGEHAVASVVTSLEDLVTEVVGALDTFGTANTRLLAFGIDSPPISTFSDGLDPMQLRRLDACCIWLRNVNVMREDDCIRYDVSTVPFRCTSLLMAARCEVSGEKDTPAELERFVRDNGRGKQLYRRIVGRHTISPRSDVRTKTPWVPEIMDDVGSVAADLCRRILQSCSGCHARFEYVAVCMCCGSALAETRVLELLSDKHALDIVKGVFHDNTFTSGMMCTIQNYYHKRERASTLPPVTIATYDDLAVYIEDCHVRDHPTTRYIVFGIHAKAPLHEEDSKFREVCKRMSAGKLVVPGPFINYLHVQHGNTFGMERVHGCAHTYAYTEQWDGLITST